MSICFFPKHSFKHRFESIGRLFIRDNNHLKILHIWYIELKKNQLRCKWCVICLHIDSCKFVAVLFMYFPSSFIFHWIYETLSFDSDLIWYFSFYKCHIIEWIRWSTDVSNFFSAFSIRLCWTPFSKYKSKIDIQNTDNNNNQPHIIKAEHNMTPMTTISLYLMNFFFSRWQIYVVSIFFCAYRSEKKILNQTIEWNRIYFCISEYIHTFDHIWSIWIRMSSRCYAIEFDFCLTSRAIDFFLLILFFNLC